MSQFYQTLICGVRGKPISWIASRTDGPTILLFRISSPRRMPLAIRAWTDHAICWLTKRKSRTAKRQMSQNPAKHVVLRFNRGRDRSITARRLSGAIFDLVVDGTDHTAHVEATFGADDVGWHGGTAFGADRQRSSLQAIVRTSLTTARIGMFSFWYGHFLLTSSGLAGGQNVSQSFDLVVYLVGRNASTAEMVGNCLYLPKKRTIRHVPWANLAGSARPRPRCDR